ncbi:hypothetical protein P152DRAFT_454991 [Eremomyces bilateralis CBS 781.70]|uniref:Uncharacterized protein n=1 Tax=Eremomyces bilateralis CBS 781.70 TaxID=1392243 RepID=A0A6G1GFV1_9PEZI|nr:uncharacterized protein P152DRAFT_454991 [Eremomyces bilateralis CBS 781.70]KAF1816749.1 hypothetical protein P152DRAFT_454991 [Eremomyces bilateralis CBS 781.70]
MEGGMPNKTINKELWSGILHMYHKEMSGISSSIHELKSPTATVGIDNYYLCACSSHYKSRENPVVYLNSQFSILNSQFSILSSQFIEFIEFILVSTIN